VQKRKHQSGILILSTFPNEEVAVRVARELIINRKLCACINLAKVRSLYSWKNVFEDHEEIIALFKTTKISVDKLKSTIKKIHPYEVPEIVEIRMDDVSELYLQWMMQSTTIKLKE
jgi:periplasmic divalent cation tolerance protein